MMRQFAYRSPHSEIINVAADEALASVAATELQSLTLHAFEPRVAASLFAHNCALTSLFLSARSV